MSLFSFDDEEDAKGEGIEDGGDGGSFEDEEEEELEEEEEEMDPEMQEEHETSAPATLLQGATPGYERESPAMPGQEVLQPNSHGPQAFVGKPIGRNWNEDFQRLLEQTFANPENELARTTELRALCDDFANRAKEIGKTIITELFIPVLQKKLPPVTPSVGGVAGGEKYVYVPEGIFFKFAVDKHGIYGGDEYIMKAAGNELRALMELMDCRVRGLHFPLIVLIDYHGYRLIAEPILPLGPKTLIYGSSDSGNTLHADIPAMNARMEKAAEILNLKGNVVWNWSRTKKVLLYGPVDIEGHLGTDNRFYVLDTARVFPPQTPVEGVKGCFLYRLLRPELVKSNPVPLSSEAFSKWNVENAAENDREVREATRRLFDEVIPQFARAYEATFQATIAPIGCGTPQGQTQLRTMLPGVVQAVHRAGINLRCLGDICTHLSPQHADLKKLLLTEAAARTIKNVLRQQMRKLQTADDMAYQDLAISYFNVVFGGSAKSGLYWRVHLKESMVRRFPNTLSTNEAASSVDLRGSMFMLTLFYRCQDILGIKFRPDGARDGALATHGMMPPSSPGLTAADFLGMEPIVKNIHRVSFEEAVAYSIKARKRMVSRTVSTMSTLRGPPSANNTLRGTAKIDRSTEDLFRMADQKYQDAIMIKPDDYRALRNYGLSLALHASTKRGKEAEALFELAAQKYRDALLINPKDAATLCVWGDMLYDQSKLKAQQGEPAAAAALLVEACKKYEQSYAALPPSAPKILHNLLYNWANVLLYRAKTAAVESEAAALFRESAERFRQAVAARPNSHHALRNWGVCLSKMARNASIARDEAEVDRLFTEAIDKFRRAVEQRPQDIEAYFNWGNSLYRHGRIKDDNGQFDAAAVLYDASWQMYVNALDIRPTYHDALYNWGKVLDCLAACRYKARLSTLSTPASPGTTRPASPDGVLPLPLAVELYLLVYQQFALCCGQRLKLAPVVALARSLNDEVRQQAIDLLEALAASATGKLQRDAVRYLKVLVVSKLPLVSPATKASASSDSLPPADTGATAAKAPSNAEPPPSLSRSGSSSSSLSTASPSTGSGHKSTNSSRLSSEESLLLYNKPELYAKIQRILQQLQALPVAAPAPTYQDAKPAPNAHMLSMSDFEILAAHGDASGSERQFRIRRKGTEVIYFMNIIAKKVMAVRLGLAAPHVDTPEPPQSANDSSSPADNASSEPTDTHEAATHTRDDIVAASTEDSAPNNHPTPEASAVATPPTEEVPTDTSSQTDGPSSSKSKKKKKKKKKHERKKRSHRHRHRSGKPESDGVASLDDSAARGTDDFSSSFSSSSASVSSFSSSTTSITSSSSSSSQSSSSSSTSSLLLGSPYATRSTPRAEGEQLSNNTSTKTTSSSSTTHTKKKKKNKNGSQKKRHRHHHHHSSSQHDTITASTSTSILSPSTVQSYADGESSSEDDSDLVLDVFDENSGVHIRDAPLVVVAPHVSQLSPLAAAAAAASNALKLMLRSNSSTDVSSAKSSSGPPVGSSQPMVLPAIGSTAPPAGPVVGSPDYFPIEVLQAALPMLDHPYILPIKQVTQTVDNVFLISDSVIGGEMLDTLLARTGRVEEDVARCVAAELVLALERIHSHEFLYGDLRPENLLVDRDGHVVLTKFAFKHVRHVGSEMYNTKYISPEVLSGEGFTRATDWWCLGNLIYEMLAGEPPFYSRNVKVQLKRITSGELHIPNELSDEAKSLLRGLLKRDTKERLGTVGGAKELEAHPFFSGVDWDAVFKRQSEPPFVPACATLRDSSTALGASFGSDLVQGDWSALEHLTTSFELFPTLMANLKRGKFHGYTYVEPKTLRPLQSDSSTNAPTAAEH